MRDKKEYGGRGRNRTGDRGFAVHGITILLPGQTDIIEVVVKFY